MTQILFSDIYPHKFTYLSEKHSDFSSTLISNLITITRVGKHDICFERFIYLSTMTVLLLFSSKVNQDSQRTSEILAISYWLNMTCQRNN